MLLVLENEFRSRAHRGPPLAHSGWQLLACDGSIVSAFEKLFISRHKRLSCWEA